MKKMTSKERVIKALNHEETDRIPLDLGGTACCLLDGVYFRLKEYLHMEGEVEPFRRGANCCYYDERIMDYFSIDIRRICGKQNPIYPIPLEGGYFQNEWGLIEREGEFGIEMKGHPLAEASIQDLETYPWLRPEACLIIEGIEERAKQIFEENQYALSLRAPCNGIFEIACWLRGTENFMIDMLEEPEFAEKLCEKITDTQISWYEYLLENTGKYLDMVETGDDYGSQNSLLISPDCLKQFILPQRRRLNEAIKKKAPNDKIFLHCCGSIAKIIPDLAEAFVDVLNPVQTRARDMDPVTLKQKYGDLVCFHGGIDTQSCMRGSKEMVKQEVQTMLTAMKGNGGYILTSCNHIQNDIPIENIIAMFDYAKEFSANE